MVSPPPAAPAPTVAAVQTDAPVAAVSIIADRPVGSIKADTPIASVSVKAETPVEADTPVAAVKADTAVAAVAAIADVFDERGTVLLDALAEGGGRNGLATDSGASDQSRRERRDNDARFHSFSC